MALGPRRLAYVREILVLGRLQKLLALQAATTDMLCLLTMLEDVRTGTSDQALVCERPTHDAK
jgi:hypothetical protein